MAHLFRHPRPPTGTPLQGKPYSVHKAHRQGPTGLSLNLRAPDLDVYEQL